MKSMSSTSLYAAIDLGSNSFHMLVVREVAGSIQTLSRIKRKVRLAAGLNSDNTLSAEAMERGWQCLRLFAERLQDIPPTQIRVVATATLRLAVNAGEFLAKAQEILGTPVQVISGEEEARLIYQGVAHTTGGADQRLVVDIGGASTELVTGTGAQTTSLFSLSMGCVTWLERYFADRSLTKENFDLAEAAAREVLLPVADVLRYHGWKVCVGASGTVQALQEIMMAQGMDERITLAKLQQLKQRAIQCGRLEELEIEGLTLERALVFPSGLAGDIAVRWVKHVPADFHARFSATARRYRYVIYNHRLRPAVLSHGVTHFHQPLDAERMQRAAQCLLGENDFTSFRAVQCQSRTPWRNVMHINVTRYGAYVVVDIKANAFVHHMVRNIVGSLMEVGAGNQPESWMAELLAAKDRTLAAATAKAEGLYLVSVDYPAHYDLPVLPMGPLFLAD